MRPSKLYIVMPCFNEGKGLIATAEAVREKLSTLIREHKIDEGSAMLFSDDGSLDDTWAVIEELNREFPEVKGIKLAANRGKEYALYAGLMEARTRADIVVCMDADLQHDIHAIDRFLEKYQEGYDLVYGIKNNRGREPFYKRVCSAAFYGLMHKLGSPIIKDHSDYSLMSRNVLNALSEYGESNFIFRGILRSLGFRQIGCHFDELDRHEGVSKFSPPKLFNLSMDAITSFSVAPLRLIGLIGLGVVLISLIMICWTVADFFTRNTPNGWATLACSIWFIGGITMICMAVVGEYLGKMYMETKKRPRYFIEKKTGSKNDESN